MWDGFAGICLRGGFFLAGGGLDLSCLVGGFNLFWLGVNLGVLLFWFGGCWLCWFAVCLVVVLDWYVVDFGAGCVAVNFLVNGF